MERRSRPEGCRWRVACGPGTNVGARSAALNRCYAQVSERESHGRWRRRLLRTVLLLGPVAAAAGVALLGVTAVLAQPSRIAFVAALAGAVVMACTLWRTAAVLALAANVLGVMAVIVNEAPALPSSSRGPLAGIYLALAALVALSALVMAQREPPRAASEQSGGGAPDTGVPIAEPTWR